MKTNTVVIIVSSVILIGITVTLSVLIPYYNAFDPSKFRSDIEREVSDESFLPYLLDLENISENSSYFNSIKSGDYHLNIENVTLLIEKEELFLQNYDEKDFTRNKWRYHTFVYNGILTQPISKSEFNALVPDHPTYLFYQNHTTLEYTTMTSFNQSTSDQSLWGIDDIVDHVFSFFLAYIFVNQTVIVSDVYAPLAGTGTQFHRFIVCDPVTGVPLLFMSDEGGWWIS